MTQKNYFLMGPSGGSGGTPKFPQQGTFEDKYHYFLQSHKLNDFEIESIDVWSGHLIDKIQIHNTHGNISLGGLGGNLEKCYLNNRHIKKVFGTYDRFLVTFGIELDDHKKSTKVWGGLGGEGRLSYEYNAPDGYVISGLFGNCGNYVDSIGVILTIDPNV